MSHEFSGFLQILLRRNLELKYFTDVRIPSNNARKKGKERKRLTCNKVKYRLRNQFEVCGAFSLG